MTMTEAIDKLEAEMVKVGSPVECPVTHRFTPGMYIREIFMPAGTWVTSMTHNTVHPFFVLQGKANVYSDNDGAQIIEAPYVGVTTPGTRRVLEIITDCIWCTCHPTDIQPKGLSEHDVLDAVKLVAEVILDTHENDVLGGHYINNHFVPESKLVTNKIKN